MNTTPSTRLVIPSRLEEVPPLQARLQEELRERGYDEKVAFGVRLALEEALSNAIRHGNAGDPDKQITVEYSLGQDRIQISVYDEGGGFEPEGLPDPTLEENLDRPCGRGVMLMRAYMDEVRFNQAGNGVTLIKQCKPSA